MWEKLFFKMKTGDGKRKQNAGEIPEMWETW